ncbi:uncharacterized protein LOC114462083 [Gouania willdenowi]|uniref:uncharacterized protein LOC114462083 n=1 Tax=Gouania willdenowi TaxID=441366 RepID=UPI0010548426|nr:ankyrin repeat and LEM domain-containing protein 1 [Gouania willdenowi]
MDGKKKSLESQLCKAVKDGEPRSVQLLLSAGAHPDMVGRKGVAAIHLAVGKESEKNTRCLRLLLRQGANPNIRSAEGLTPLHVAALWGCFQNIKLLLMNGGNPNIKDDEGNTPQQLAEQQENRKCALLLQEYQSSSVEKEDEDLPQFHYSVYSDLTDTSSYSDSDYSLTSHLSGISDFGEVPLSSTRRSSFFNLSTIDNRPSFRGMPSSRPSGASLLSSTRMSEMGLLKNDSLFTDHGTHLPKDKALTAPNEGIASPSRRDNLPVFSSFRTSRKSVSFNNIDEHFPVFSPESPKQHPGISASPSVCTLPFDMSDYSDFLDTERMATVLDTQGIDVTSPDHVYVFCRESSESTEEDLEKTVIRPRVLEESDDEQEGEDVKVIQMNVPDKNACLYIGSSSSSGTGGSHYSSCESDHYTSALDSSEHPRQLKEVADQTPPISTDSEQQSTRHNEIDPPTKAEPEIGLKPETTGPVMSMRDNLTLSEVNHTASDSSTGPCENSSSTHSVDQLVPASKSTLHEASAQSSGLKFTPSPFVTGRTCSRLSRCSMKTSRTESLNATSLFDDTLPTPVRSCRKTPRSQSSKDTYGSPQTFCNTSSMTGGVDKQDSQSCAHTLGSSVSNSQADTFILPKGDCTAGSQSLCDTIIIEKKEDDSMDAYEQHLAEIILVIQGKKRSQEEFLTDDLTSADEEKATTGKNVSAVESQDDPNTQDVCITEDCSSQSDSASVSASASSSSSSSYFSPRRSNEDHLPCSQGTGCTPRYSMSRLSSRQRPQSLASLSYTPGGRPLIRDLDEPVEYLYTDTEQGHRLIETHVPPTSDTTLSSSLSISSSEETVLYDWRSMLQDMKAFKGKENQKPQVEPLKEESNGFSDSLLKETRGLTDKKLRQKLVELGESPGPISSRTRPTYMRRLCRLLQDSNSQSQHGEEQIDPSQTDLGYSPELCRVLRTFNLPDCNADEQALCQQFDQPDQNRKWREGKIKSSFNYLLLDPRVTKNLPFRSNTMTPHECFQTFIHAIFYVGKGKRSRPYSHLYEALEYFKGDKTAKKLCPKVQHILQVWNAGQGVISLHCFQNVIPVEAYTREACMVEAISLKMLTNQKRGDFYGVVSNWQGKRKREVGVHLLYRAMQIFLAEGERQLRPADIRQ